MIKKKFNVLIIIFVMFILLFGVSSFIALSPSLYFNEAKKTGANEILENSDYLYENVHDFLFLKNSISQEFTINEISHMRDVLLIFNFFRIVSLLFLLSLCAYLFFIFNVKNLKERNLLIKNFISSINKGVILSFFSVLLLILLVFLDFSTSFKVFHQVFFPQGNWMFQSNSLLLILFPQSFFINLAQKIFIILLIIISALATSLFFIKSRFK